MNKLNKISLYLWFIISVATLGYALVIIGVDGWEKGSPNLFLPLIAISWFLFKLGMYKRMMKNGQ